MKQLDALTAADLGSAKALRDVILLHVTQCKMVYARNLELVWRWLGWLSDCDLELFLTLKRMHAEFDRTRQTGRKGSSSAHLIYPWLQATAFCASEPRYAQDGETFQSYYGRVMQQTFEFNVLSNSREVADLHDYRTWRTTNLWTRMSGGGMYDEYHQAARACLHVLVSQTQPQLIQANGRSFAQITLWPKESLAAFLTRFGISVKDVLGTTGDWSAITTATRIRWPLEDDSDPRIIHPGWPDQDARQRLLGVMSALHDKSVRYRSEFGVRSRQHIEIQAAILWFNFMMFFAGARGTGQSAEGYFAIALGEPIMPLNGGASVDHSCVFMFWEALLHDMRALASTEPVTGLDLLTEFVGGRLAGDRVPV